MLKLEESNFQKEVTEVSGKVFVYYYTDEAELHKTLEPFVKEMSEKYNGKMKFTSLDSAKEKELAESQGITIFPTVDIFENGQKIMQLIKDDCTQESIEQIIKDYI